MSITPRTSSARNEVRQVAPKLIELSETVLYGDVWERPGLSKRDRSLITVAALVAMALWMPDLIHLPRPPHAGHSPNPVVHTWAIVWGALVITFVGALDDRYNLRPHWKLLGQVAERRRLRRR